VKDGQIRCRVVLLLTNGRQYPDSAVPDFQLRLAPFTVGISELDSMQALDANLCHLVGDRVATISGQAVDAHPDQEIRSEFLCRAEQLVDVALPVATVNMSCRSVSV